MVIRNFEPRDLDAILQLFHDVVHSIGAKYYDQTQVNAWAPHEGQDRDKWLKSLSENYTYVAEENGQVIGFGDMTSNGYIDRLYVHQKHQGKRISLDIFRKLEADAISLGLSELTCNASIMLKSLAERYGFETLSEETTLCRGVPFTTYKMCKKLC